MMILSRYDYIFSQAQRGGGDNELESLSVNESPSLSLISIGVISSCTKNDKTMMIFVITSLKSEASFNVEESQKKIQQLQSL